MSLKRELAPPVLEEALEQRLPNLRAQWPCVEMFNLVNGCVLLLGGLNYVIVCEGTQLKMVGKHCFKRSVKFHGSVLMKEK